MRVLNVGGSECFQTVLTLDARGAKVLVDVGWDSLLSSSVLKRIVPHIGELDLVLLTHPSVEHIGAFCLLRHRFPGFREVPVFATLPVIRLGLLATLEAYRSAGITGPFASAELSVREIEKLWAEVRPVRYSQPVQVLNSPRLEQCVLTAYNAGHSLGGSLWRISDEVDQVVVALDWNHARDAHLSGAFLEQKTGTVIRDLRKPSLLVTSTNAGSGQPLTKARQHFLDLLDAAIQRAQPQRSSPAGTVLLPISLPRSLELLLIVERHMAAHHGDSSKKGVPLVLLSHYGRQTLTQASSMLEWMVPSIMSDWQVQNKSPFEHGRALFSENVDSLPEQPLKQPLVVVAIGAQLENGLAQEVFAQRVAQNPKSSVIFCEKAVGGSLAHQLVSGNLSSGFTVMEEKKLTGKSLKDYLAAKQQQREERMQARAQRRRNQQLLDKMADDGEESESESEEEGSQLESGNLNMFAAKYDHHCGPNDNNLTFPYNSVKLHADEYGAESGFAVGKGSNAKQDMERDAEERSDSELELKVEEETEVEEDEELELEHPLKLVRRKIALMPTCTFELADLSGLSGMRSIQMVLKQVAPARVVALPGDPDVQESLKTLSKQFQLANPTAEFERMNFSVQVRLDPRLRVRWKDVRGGYSVARVEGKLDFEDGDLLNRREIELVRSSPGELPPPKRVALGDLRLTALRDALNARGIKAEFSGQGVLLCGDKVVVKKTNDTFTLQGGVDPEYYAVRQVLREFVVLV